MEVTIPDEAFLSLSGLKMRILDELSFINPYLSFAVLIPLADEISKSLGKYHPDQLKEEVKKYINLTTIRNYNPNTYRDGAFSLKEVLCSWDYGDAQRFLEFHYDPYKEYTNGSK